MPNKPAHHIPEKDLSSLVFSYVNNPCQVTRDALQCRIVALCYLNRSTKGQYSGGKSGSLAFNINPDPKKDAQSKKQHDTYQEVIKKVNELMRYHARSSHQPLSDFTWQGSTVFQIKQDPTKKKRTHLLDLSIIHREELNDNIAELIVNCISDEIDARGPITIAQHPTAHAFTDESGETIIASQYLSHTIDTLSGFVSRCIQNLYDVDPNLIREKNLDIDVASLRKKYQSFHLNHDEEITIVDRLPSSSQSRLEYVTLSKKHQMVERDDLDQLATLFVLNHSQVDPYSSMSLDQPIKQYLLGELSFSHLIADHDVNPGNFIVRATGNDLSISRIDFGMANYHFTRGRIYGISRRPFKNLISDIPKESFKDFICRKKIGFGLGTIMNPFLVISKTFKHLQGIKSLFLSPKTKADHALVEQITSDNLKMHQFVASAASRSAIIKSFLDKIGHLPHQNQIDVLRDLKIMELQSIRSSYLNFSPGHRLRSTLKLLSMITLTPFLASCRLLSSPFFALFNRQNPIPLTTWTLIQTMDLEHTLRDARRDPLQTTSLITSCLDRVLSNISLENKRHLSIKSRESIIHDSMLSQRFTPNLHELKRRPSLSRTRPNQLEHTDEQDLSKPKK